MRRVEISELLESEEVKILNTKRKPLSKMVRLTMAPFDNECYPYYGAAGIIDFISDYKLNGSYLLVAEDGTIYSNGNAPMVTRATGKIWVSNHAHILQSEEEDFLYYALLAEDISPYVTGAVQPKLSKGNLLKVEINWPEIEDRRAIAEVLSSLDDKIELLQKQNETLEALAQTLFRQWFIEEAEDSWEEVSLTEIASFLNGLACQKYPPLNDEDKLPVLKIRDLKDGISDASDRASSKVDSKYLVNNGDVIFSWSASLVVKIWDGELCVLNQHLFKVTSEKYPKWFYYQWCKYHLNRFIAVANAHATTMGHIKRTDLNNAMVVIPKEQDLERMSPIVEPLMDKIQLNNEQIRTVEIMRDTLLPKLMSGQVSVELD